MPGLTLIGTLYNCCITIQMFWFHARMISNPFLKPLVIHVLISQPQITIVVRWMSLETQ